MQEIPGTPAGVGQDPHFEEVIPFIVSWISHEIFGEMLSHFVIGKFLDRSGGGQIEEGVRHGGIFPIDQEKLTSMIDEIAVVNNSCL